MAVAEAARQLDDAAARSARWQAARRVALLCAVDPHGLGGALVKAHPGPARDRWLGELRALAGPPILKASADVPDDRLLGGLDLAATLAAGRPVLESGLMARADGGLLIVSGAERLPPSTAARIASALDAGAVSVARDGISSVLPARLGVVLLDEGEGGDETPPSAILDRLAFRIDLEGLALADLGEASEKPDPVDGTRARLDEVEIGDAIIAALCEGAAAFGITSPRAALLAVRAARAIAASGGKSEVDADAAREAAALVFAPRAVTMPGPPPDESDEHDPPEPDREPPAEPDPQDPATADAETLKDSIVEAVRAVLPADLLAALLEQSRQGRQGGGRAAAKTKSHNRGRQVGVRPGAPRGGARLDVLATLRTAAPWQRLRRPIDAPAEQLGKSAAGRIAIRRDDFRIRRFEQASTTLTIFVVDASGSAALHRLGEAKGAVELLLADCYVRRDSVALISFRGTGSALDLPPTRSLTRAKRTLAGLPGGGGTPLAHALIAAGRLAEDARRRGTTATVVLLTDCRSNVALDGRGGRARAEADALEAARSLARGAFQVLLVDTAPRPYPFAAELTAALRARYLALPFSDARRVADAARAMGARSTPASGR